MTDIEDIIDERQRTHGDFRDVSRTAQDTKELWRRGKNWGLLPLWMREGLDMVAHKAARILSGDPFVLDHWDDMAGYAKRVASYIAIAPAKTLEPTAGLFSDQVLVVTIHAEPGFRKSTRSFIIGSEWELTSFTEANEMQPASLTLLQVVRWQEDEDS
jgi:hypothetical protein